MQDSYIYIDGIDGTGKTTLVAALKNAGYKHVFDRSILTALSLIPITNLPNKIISNNKIIDQLDQIKRDLANKTLITNRDMMTKLNWQDLDENESEQNNVIYLILDASVKTCLARLEKRQATTDIKLNLWDSETSISYFRPKYLYIAYKYQIQILDTENIFMDDVYQLSLKMINKIIVPQIYYKFNTIQLINLDILELEWLYFGISKIIYADDKVSVYNSSEIFDIECYQKKVLEQITKFKLDNFVNKLKG